MDIATEMIQQSINQNAKVPLKQEEYQKRYDGLVQRFNATKANLETVSAALNDKVPRRKTIEIFLHALKKQEQQLTDFDPLLWRSLVEYVTVFKENKVDVTFKNGINKQLI